MLRLDLLNHYPLPFDGDGSVAAGSMRRGFLAFASRLKADAKAAFQEDRRAVLVLHFLDIGAVGKDEGETLMNRSQH